MKHDEREYIKKAYREACERMEQDNASCEGGDIASGLEDVEKLVEEVHEAGRMDKRKGALRLLEKLEREERKRRKVRMRRLWSAVSGVAAVAALMLGWQGWLKSEAEEAGIHGQVVLADFAVPTIVYTEEDDSILAFDSLDMKTMEIGQGESVASGKRLTEDKRERVRYNRIIIPKGYTYKVRLADGSSVTLNAGSELKYPTAFGNSVRSVELKGEGFFEVAKSDIPFVVQAGDAQVKVYGTQFNLFYSEKLAMTEAVLVEGRIGMKVGDREVKIVPNERICYITGSDDLKVDVVDASAYTLWQGATFKFDNMPLERVVYNLSQWYGVEIAVAADLKTEHYTLEFDKTSSLEWVMKALELITGQTVKKEGGAYLIY